MNTDEDILRALAGLKCDLNSEMATHDCIAEALRTAGVSFEREVRISPQDRLDFLCASRAVEVKLDGQAKAIYRQVERYAKSDRVTSIVVATARALRLPGVMNGKPVKVFSLSKAWL